jgi:hypothetical protein
VEVTAERGALGWRVTAEGLQGGGDCRGASGWRVTTEGFQGGGDCRGPQG